MPSDDHPTAPRPAHPAQYRPGPHTPLPPELDPHGSRGRQQKAERARGRRRSDVLSGLVIGGRVVAAMLSLALLVGAGYAWANYRQFNAAVSRVDAIAPSHKPKKDVDGTAQNILLVGIDDRDTISAKQRKEIGVPSDGGTLNTDTMMILHVPADGKAASVISFPRDSWVHIAGFGTDKLNSAYPYGVQKYGKSKGWQVLVDTLQNLTGLTIDHFVAMNLYGFYEISRAVGGVPVCLTRSYTRAETNASMALPAGHFTVQGKRALAFVRQRDHLPRGDLDRIVRQQYFLSALFRQIESKGVLLNPLRMQRLIKSVASSLEVDKHIDLLKLAQQMSDLTAGKLRFTQIPSTSGSVNNGNTSVQLVDASSIPTFVNKFFGVDVDPALQKAKTVDPTSVSVDVRNGSGRSRWASTNASTLKRVGFTTTSGDWPSLLATTTVLYPAGQEAQAKTVAQYVPGVALVKSASVKRVTLVLGGDGKTASTRKSAVNTSGTRGTASGNKKNDRTAAQAGCIA